ncbi:MAG: histidine kinase [Pseudomonadota bacterium]
MPSPRTTEGLDATPPEATSRHAKFAINPLLIASGLFAISLAAVFTGMQFGYWPSLLFHAAFALCFFALAVGGRLGMSLRAEQGTIAAQFALLLSGWLVAPADISLILSVVMMAQAPYALSRRASWLLMLLINAAFFVVFRLLWSEAEVVFTWVSMFALQSFALTSSLARVQEAEIKHQLFLQNIELTEARSALAERSQLEERLRIAGDLHDSIGHQLTALRLQLEGLAQLVPGELRDRVAASQTLSGELLDNIRAIVKRMSTDDGVELAALIEQMDRGTPGVAIRLTGELPVFEPALSVQLASCIKEGVTNAIRHGGATRIDIGFGDRRIVMDDNGAGVAQDSERGFGLNNLVSRLAPFGGRVELSNRSPRGARLAITVTSGMAPARGAAA